MKRNPWSEAPTNLREERVPVCYSDGTTFEVVLRELAPTTAGGATEQAEEYEGMFCGLDKEGYQKVFTSPDGEKIPIHPKFCETAATLEAMQAQEDKYTFAELVGLATRMKPEWEKLVLAAARVQTGGGVGLPPKVGAGLSSAPPSTTINPIPPSPGSEQSASGASTSGSEASAGRSGRRAPALTSPSPPSTT